SADTAAQPRQQRLGRELQQVLTPDFLPRYFIAIHMSRRLLIQPDATAFQSRKALNSPEHRRIQ
ncbi:MAG: hypothetical protein ACPGXX_13145, partial [Planctomycetaceae bacterium]